MGNKAYKFSHFLRLTTDVYADCKKSLRYKEWAKLLTSLKKEFEWLKEVNSQGLQQTLKDLETAYSRFFKGLAKFPRFKKRSNRQSFRVPQHFSLTEDEKLKLPKMSPIKMVIHRKIEGAMKSVTISKTPSGQYYASIVTELEIPKAPLNGEKIGMDLGLKEFCITNKPEKFENPRYFQRSLRRLKIRQRRLSRKVKGSNNRKKARVKVAKIHEKVTNQRSDYQHKISLKLTCENQVISCVGAACAKRIDLNIKGMVKKPPAEELRYRKLAKQISDVAWGKFLTLLEYKGDIYGCEIKRVDRFFPSSKRCSNCGYIKEDLTLKDREWTCPECHIHHDRDINACDNLLQFSDGYIGLLCPNLRLTRLLKCSVSRALVLEGRKPHPQRSDSEVGWGTSRNKFSLN